MDLKSKNEHAFWTVKEVAEYTGLCERTVWRHIWSGKLGSVKIQGSRRIRHSQVIEYLGFDPLEESSMREVSRRQKPKADESKFPLFAMIKDEPCS